MAGYNYSFAQNYDKLTSNIPYQKRGEYFHALFQKFSDCKGILLDLACGTGSLSGVMAELGYDVIGVDSSEEMLTQAVNKKYNSGKDILYICQDMCNLDLYGSINFCICALDSINHVTNKKDVQKIFNKVSHFLEPGGLFAFDVNTLYKHQKILAQNTFVYDYDDIYCVWQNSNCSKNGTINISLDLFCLNESGNYIRQTEEFSERAYTNEEILDFLTHANLELLGCYHEDSFNPPHATSQRLIYLAKSVKKNRRG